MSALWKTAWKFLKRLMIELPYDPTIPPLGIELFDSLLFSSHIVFNSLQPHGLQRARLPCLHLLAFAQVDDH